ncbi:MAG TPA: immunoglobulin-like domain-containing protein [Pyrinomonadaceae bacterium]
MLALVALLAAAFLYSGSSAASRESRKSSAAASDSNPQVRLKATPAEVRRLLKSGLDLSLMVPVTNPLARFFQPPPVGNISTYAADCTTSKTSFVLGDTVCAKVDSVPTSSGYFINWLDSNTNIVYGGLGTTDITSDPQTFTYTLQPNDALGGWKATIADNSDSSINPTVFTVSAPPGPSVATYAYNTGSNTCTNTAKTVFNYGETICAKVTGLDPAISRRLAWIDPSGYVREKGGNNFTPLTTSPQTESFLLPSADSSVVDVFTIENRGVWKANVVTNRGSLQLSAPFTLQGPAPATDLAVETGLASGDESTGEPITYLVNVTNQGPNDAASVQLTNPQLLNATFLSVNQTGGSTTFTCTGTGPVTCTAANLPVGESAIFEFTYVSNTGGATLVNTASVTSATLELNSADNNAIAPSIRVGSGGAGGTCTLSCPANMTVYANTTQDNVRGAVVNFSLEPTGSCGTLTSSATSGSFFPVGTTTVTNSSETGGGACSFTVTVEEPAEPVIQCQSDVAVVLGVGDTEADVAVANPSTNGAAAVGVRSDNLALGDPYPLGTTTITWTLTGAENHTATCEQKVMVQSAPGDDPPTISCPADQDVTAADGACSANVTVGTPTTTGNGTTVSGERGDNLALTAPYPAGTTIITWTVTDSSGRSASCLQTVNVSVTDTSAPTVTAPPNKTINTRAGECSIFLDDSQLGVGTASDNCTGVTITVTGMPAGNIFPTGQTVLTYTAIDAAGNTSTPATQVVTVKENPAVKPVITLNGSATMTVECHTAFTDPGATATDNCDGATAVTTEGTVNPDVVGTYTITYHATDRSGNAAVDVTRTVTVQDTIAPTITLIGADPLVHECHTTFTDPGATADDSCAGDLTSAITKVSDVDPDKVGDYTITYTVSDGHNTTTKTRAVQVRDTTPPVITLTGAVISLWPPNHGYTTINLTQLVASASDSCDSGVDINDVVITKVTSDELENSGGDGNTLNDIVIAANCKSAQLRRERNGNGNGRVYTFTFRVTDPSGNSTTATATVTVPKSQNGAGAVNDGVNYTVNSSCQ